MLRNIPNKIDQVRNVAVRPRTTCSLCKGMLKQILDETSQGCYDFMYLRIGKFLVNACFDFNS